MTSAQYYPAFGAIRKAFLRNRAEAEGDAIRKALWENVAAAYDDYGNPVDEFRHYFPDSAALVDEDRRYVPNGNHVPTDRERRAARLAQKDKTATELQNQYNGQLEDAAMYDFVDQLMRMSGDNTMKLKPTPVLRQYAAQEIRMKRNLLEPWAKLAKTKPWLGKDWDPKIAEATQKRYDKIKDSLYFFYPELETDDNPHYDEFIRSGKSVANFVGPKVLAKDLRLARAASDPAVRRQIMDRKRQAKAETEAKEDAQFKAEHPEFAANTYGDKDKMEENITQYGRTNGGGRAKILSDLGYDPDTPIDADNAKVIGKYVADYLQTKIQAKLNELQKVGEGVAPGEGTLKGWARDIVMDMDFRGLPQKQDAERLRRANEIRDGGESQRSKNWTGMADRVRDQEREMRIRGDSASADKYRGLAQVIERKLGELADSHRTPLSPEAGKTVVTTPRPRKVVPLPTPTPEEAQLAREILDGRMSIEDYAAQCKDKLLKEDIPKIRNKLRPWLSLVGTPDWDKMDERQKRKIFHYFPEYIHPENRNYKRFKASGQTPEEYVASGAAVSRVGHMKGFVDDLRRKDERDQRLATIPKEYHQAITGEPVESDLPARTDSLRSKIQTLIHDKTAHKPYTPRGSGSHKFQRPAKVSDELATLWGGINAKRDEELDHKVPQEELEARQRVHRFLEGLDKFKAERMAKLRSEGADETTLRTTARMADKAIASIENRYNIRRSENANEPNTYNLKPIRAKNPDGTEGGVLRYEKESLVQAPPAEPLTAEEEDFLAVMDDAKAKNEARTWDPKKPVPKGSWDEAMGRGPGGYVGDAAVPDLTEEQQNKLKSGELKPAKELRAQKEKYDSEQKEKSKKQKKTSDDEGDGEKKP